MWVFSVYSDQAALISPSCCNAVKPSSSPISSTILPPLSFRTVVLKEPFRMVVSHAGEPLDLSKAPCTRTISPNGQLFEFVNLNGGDYGLSDEDLERSSRTFPLKSRKRNERDHQTASPA